MTGGECTIVCSNAKLRSVPFKRDICLLVRTRSKNIAKQKYGEILKNLVPHPNKYIQNFR
jgi:hypothetical protein